MFFVDKYSPEHTNEYFYHKDVLDNLDNFSKDDGIPHTLFYGPNGCGKKTMVNAFLEKIFDKSIRNTQDTEYNVSGSGNTKKKILIKQSNHHIVIEANGTNFDRYLIRDIVKDYAKSNKFNVFKNNKSFKIVVIKNIDIMSYYAQTSLRRTMEKYSKNCRFIMISNSLTQIIDPLRSRCCLVKIKYPHDHIILAKIYEINLIEKLNLSLKQCYDIIKTSKKNIKTIYWKLDLHKSVNCKIQDDFPKTLVNNYHKEIRKFVSIILKPTITISPEIRRRFYDIFITNIDCNTIIKDITLELLNEKKLAPFYYDIIDTCSKAYYSCFKGRRPVIHFESFIFKLCSLINNKKSR